MVRDPRVVFDTLFGVLRLDETPEERRAATGARPQHSGLDAVVARRLHATLGAGDRARLSDYLDNVREVERRIRAVEALQPERRGAGTARSAAGVPDSFSDHVRLMFDLQVLAFASDVTRVFAFKLGRDNSNRTYPESGFGGAFHPTSHHSGKEAKILEFATAERVSREHDSVRAREAEEHAGRRRHLLDNTLLLYGSAMGDSNQHNHKRVPFFMAGRGGGALKGGAASESRRTARRWRT